MFNDSRHADAIPYGVWWNFEKAILAVILAAFMRLASRRQPLAVSPVRIICVSVTGIVLTILLALGIGYIRWEPKFISIFWLWAFTNLFVTCAGEEALFRGFLQTESRNLFSNPKLKAGASLALSSALFGLAHFSGGLEYIVLATVAGVFYGIVFQMTGRLWVSIVLHFIFNATHFVFFTYPEIQK